MKKWLAVVLKFLVSGFLIWFLLGKVDVDQAMARMRQVAPGTLLLATGVFLLQMAIGGFRWRVVLDAIGAPLSTLTAIRLFYIGIFFNQALPSSVGGDAVRMYKAYRTGMGLAPAINGVMLERIATVFALVAIVALTQPWFLPKVDPGHRMWIGAAVALTCVAAVAGVALLMLLDRLPETMRRWRLVRGLALLAADTRKIFLQPGPLFRVLFWAALGHINITYAVYILAVGLNINVTWLDCITLVPPVLLATTLPISIAGWGVRESAMVAAFALVGVPGEGALVLSLLTGFIGLAIALPGGVLWLVDSDRRIGGMPAVSEAAPEPVESKPGGLGH